MHKLTRYCLAVDLKDDELLIKEYEDFHKNIPNEIRKSIIGSGILNMEIYRTGNRMFMIMEVDESFSFEKKSAADKENVAVQRWENLMWKYQQPLAWAKANEKWILMDKIFTLEPDVQSTK